MDIKTTSESSPRGATQSKKEEEKIPSRSFKEVMTSNKPTRFPARRRNVFDLASKEKKKNHPEQKTPHGEGTNQISSQSLLGEIEVTDTSELSLEISSLIEEMANYVKIESENGISTITVKIGMEGSLFNGAEVVIDHYDTAPHSFNLQLMGTPEATELFNANLGALRASLGAHAALKSFQINLLEPILIGKSELYTRGRSKEEKKGLKKGTQRLFSVRKK